VSARMGKVAHGRRECEVKTPYSPAFKFQVVLEALKAEGKGIEAQVVRENPEAVLLIARNGPLRSAMEDLACALDLESECDSLKYAEKCPSR